MVMRSVWLTSCAALLATLGASCKKSEPAQSALPAAALRAPLPPPAETVARVHWLGKKRLAADTSATHLLGIWNLPESTRLEARALDKLALAPWRLLKDDAATNGAPTRLLRSLIEDLVAEESYLEVRYLTNHPGELAFAIRLSAERAGLWETNLAVVLESLTGIRPRSAPDGRSGWSLKKHDPPNLVELTHADEWTVVGLAHDHNALFADLLAHIQSDGAPFAARATNSWLEADLDPRRIGSVRPQGWNLPGDWPKISLTATGEGDDVRTRGELNFSKPLRFELEKWNIPTNLIHSPLESFTAIQGIQRWLTSLKVASEFQLGEPPNQFYFWALQGIPIQTYFAAPWRDAGNRVNRLTEQLVQKGNAWLATNGIGNFERSKDADGVIWTGPPFMSPYLKSVVEGEHEFVFGGLFAPAFTNRPPPSELLQVVVGTTNLVCYDWELTGPRLLAWIYTGQLLRFVSHQAQLPPESPSMKWFKTAAPGLGNCVTVVTRTGPGRLSFVRKSSMGFTAVELHLLADWLESPEFPRGLNTFLSPPVDPAPHLKPLPPATPQR